MGGLPDFFTIEEAGRIIRVGRSSAYALAREFLATGGVSGLPVVRFGRLLRVPRVALEDLLGGTVTWPTAPPEPEASVRELERRSVTTRQGRGRQSSLPFAG